MMYRKWKSKKMYQKIAYCICVFPLDIIRDLTIPPFEKQRWNRPMFIMMPITIPLFLIGVFRLDIYLIAHWPYFLVFFAIMIILSMLIFCTTYRNTLPKYEGVIILLMTIYLGAIRIWLCDYSIMAMGNV